MLDFISPDGQIGSPLQAIGFLLAALLGLGIILNASYHRTRLGGVFGLVSAIWRIDTLAVIALVLLTGLNLFHHAVAPLEGVFRPEVGDGGLVENLTITVMIFPVIWFAWSLLHREPASHLGRVFMAVASLILILAFGEEVSWGQHWFGFQVPEAIASTNLQEEINLHNYVEPGMMEALYFGAGIAMLAFAANLQLVFEPSQDAPGFLALKVLLVLSAVLMCHHVFQELAELAVITSGFLIWKRLDDGRIGFRPPWMKSIATA